MHQIEHPETIMLIHKTMVQGEMERNAGIVRDDTERPGPTAGPGNGIRVGLSNMLIKVATWLRPADRPVDGELPLGRPN